VVRSPLRAIRFVADRFASIITVGACTALVIATLHIVADVFMTRFFRTPIIGTYDIVTRYYMVALFFLPLAHAEVRRAHIKADLFFNMLPARAGRLVEIFTYTVLSGFLIALTWQSTLRAIRQTTAGDMRLIGDFYLYLWPARWIVVLGFAAFAVVAVLKTIALLIPGEVPDETEDEPEMRS
jgi:TRAP-type C4-dicarboxylate transport system permease small subunit